MSTEKTKRVPPCVNFSTEQHQIFETHLANFMNPSNDNTIRHDALEAMLKMAAGGYHRRGHHLLYNEVDTAMRELRTLVENKINELGNKLCPKPLVEAPGETIGRAVNPPAISVAP